MRYCENEATAVFENQGDDLAVLLRDVADTLDEYDYVWAGVNVGAGFETTYLVTLYLH